MLKATVSALALVLALASAANPIQDAVDKLSEGDKSKIEKCLRENKLAAGDLKTYNTTAEIPDDSPELCFYRCFYIEFGFLDKDGNILFENLEKSEIRKNIKNFDAMKKCLQDLKAIKECKDLKKVGVCYKDE